jgi:uridine kinase
MVIEEYADLARRVLTAPPGLGHTRLVAVDGPSGAGKTRFAERLAAALPPETPVVHTDDLLDGWGDQLTFWDRLEDQVLRPLAAEEPGRYRAYDWTAGRFGDEWHTVPPAPVVILDGVSTARASIRPRLALSVFVVTPVDLRRQRSLARDGEALLPSLREWWVGEERHFAADATADHADLLVDGGAIVPNDEVTQYVRLDG